MRMIVEFMGVKIKVKFKNPTKCSLFKWKKFPKFLSQWHLGIFHPFFNLRLPGKLKISISKTSMNKTKTNKNKLKKPLSRKKCQQFSDLIFQRNKKLKFLPRISQKAIGSFETLNKSVKTNSKLTQRLGGTVHLGERT